MVAHAVVLRYVLQRAGLRAEGGVVAGTIKRGPFTGHLQVKGDRRARRWHAFVSGPAGKRQRILGPAHVKDSGRTTARGATIWRAGDGSRPSSEHLTPADAEARLDALMDELASSHAGAPTEPAVVRRTFGEARLEWLRYVAKDRKRERSTITDYENTSARDLLPEFGADTPLSGITTDRIDAWRERLTEEEKLSPRSIQKAMVLLNGIFRRAKRKGWVATNPVEDAEKVVVRASGDFNVLSVEELEACIRAIYDETLAVAVRTAAGTGLRIGELRALRWQDVDFAQRKIQVRWNYVHNQRKRPKSSYVRSVPMADQVARAIEGLSRRDHSSSRDDLVFTTIFGDSDHVLRQGFYAGLMGAGLGHLRRPKLRETDDEPMIFHDLRHTFGTLAVKKFPLTDVKTFMGHADINTTLIYVHHVPSDDASDNLTDVFAPARVDADSERCDACGRPVHRASVGA